MSSKLAIKGTTEEIDLPRGAPIPREGDILHLILRGKKKSITYEVYLIEHTFDFNMALPIGNTLITLVPIKTKVD